jgi:hypothetical protein
MGIPDSFEARYIAEDMIFTFAGREILRSQKQPMFIETV